MNARHYVLANGTYSAEFHRNPIHDKSEDGTWQPIDTSLKATSRPGFATANETNVIKTYLPSRSDGWVRVEADGTAISFRPIAAMPVTGNIGVDGMTCVGAWANTTLTYTIKAGSLKETLTLTAPSGPGCFQFGLQSEGLQVVPNPDNSISLNGPVGSATLRIEAPWMFDAAGRTSSANETAITNTPNGLVYTLTPSAEWLATARYPVVIDPTVTYSADTAVVKKTQTNTQYSPGVNTNGTTTGDYLACGALSSSEAYRSVLGYAVSFPMDCDINKAEIELYRHHALDSYGSSVTVQPYLLPSTLGWSGGITWSNVGAGVPDDATDPSFVLSAMSGSVTIDVTNIVDEWVAGDQTGHMNVLLRDVEDYGGTPTQNVVFLETDDPRNQLTVFYTPGWYTLQGNRGRTGATKNWLSYGLEGSDYTVTETSMTTTNGPDPDPALPPSLVTTPDPNNPSAIAPLVYAAIPGRKGTSQNPVYMNSRVYRVNAAGDTMAANLQGIQVTGTPVALGNTVIVTGNEVESDGDIVQGHVIRLDAMPSNNPTALTVVWDTEIPDGWIYSSPLFCPLVTEYTLREENEEDQTVYNYDGAIIVSATEGYTGFMYAKSLTTGLDVWGVVDENGALLEPPPSLDYHSSHSSPSMNRTTAYTNDASCYVIARDLVDGTNPWESSFWYDSSTVEGSISLFAGRLFYGDVNGHAISAIENQYHTGADFSWFIDDDLDSIWTTFAYDQPNEAAVFADDSAQVVSVACVPALPPYADINWSVGPVSSGVMRPSPVVSLDGCVYIAADDAYVHVLETVDGDELGQMGIPEPDEGNWVIMPFNASKTGEKIRASIAPWAFGYYVLTSGTNPTLYRVTLDQQ